VTRARCMLRWRIQHRTYHNRSHAKQSAALRAAFPLHLPLRAARVWAAGAQQYDICRCAPPAQHCMPGCACGLLWAGTAGGEQKASAAPGETETARDNLLSPFLLYVFVACGMQGAARRRHAAGQHLRCGPP